MEERKDIKHYEERFVEEDEINLRELFEVLVKNKLTIIMVFIVVAIITVIVAFSNIKNNRVVQTTIQYNFENIEEGKNPNGTSFDKDSILPINILDEIYRKYELSNIFDSFITFKDSIFIEGIISTSVLEISKQQLAQGKFYNYTPIQYKISMKIKDSNLGKRSLEEAIKKGKENFQEKNSTKKIISEIKFTEKDLETYDYIDFINIFSGVVKEIYLNISEKEEMGGSKLGVSYSTLLQEVKLMESIELENYIGTIESEGLSKNIEKLEKNSINKIERLERKREEQVEKIAFLETVLKAYKPPEKAAFLLGTSKDTAELKKEDEYYSKLIQKYMDELLEIANINGEIRTYKANISSLKVPEKEMALSIENSTKKIEEKLNKIIKKLNLLNEEEYLIERGNMVVSITPVIATSGNKAKLILSIGLLMGALLGIAVALIKDFIGTKK